MLRFLWRVSIVAWALAVLPNLATAQFDIVYSVPDDELPLVYDQFNRPTYQVLTSNTQVNVLDGAYFYQLSGGVLRGVPLIIGSESMGLINTEVNVNGGELYRLYVHGGTTTMVSGGSTDLLIAYAGANVHIDGGFIQRVQAEGGSQVFIESASLGRLDVVGGSVTTAGTTIADRFDVTGGLLQVDGGVFADYSDVSGVDAILRATGGLFEYRVSVEAGATAEVMGGHFAGGLGFSTGTNGIVSGGRIDTAFGGGLSAFGDVALVGNEFRVDGQPVIAGQAVQVTAQSEVTGIFPDGTAFAFALSDGDAFRTSGTSFTLQPADIPVAQSGQYLATQLPNLAAVRSDQVLIVDNGGVMPREIGVQMGGTLIVEPGGQIDDDVEVAGGTMVVEGGTLLGTAKAFAGGEIAFRGGQHLRPVYDQVARALAGGIVRIEGGSVERVDVAQGTAVMEGGLALTIDAEGGRVDVNGGTVGNARIEQLALLRMTAGQVDTLTIDHRSSGLILDGTLGTAVLHAGASSMTSASLLIAGGQVQGAVTLRGGTLQILGGDWAGGLVPSEQPGTTPASVDIYGRDFAVDGEMLNLVEGSSMVVPLGAGVLTTLLADGNPFQLDLAAALSNNLPSITVHQVIHRQGDFNDDGRVDLGDYTLWRDALGSTSAVADADYDGLVTQQDYDIWQARFGTSYASSIAAVQIPEPNGAWLVAVGVVAYFVRPMRTALRSSAQLQQRTGQISALPWGRATS